MKSYTILPNYVLLQFTLDMATFHRLLGLIVLLQCTRSFVGETTPQPKGTTLESAKDERMFFGYYPNYGYEPYWADGEWVLSATNTSTTKIPIVCGAACNHFFRRIKHVCARQSGDENDPDKGCGIELSLKCSGKPGLDYNHGYKTFDTYCEFLAAQCKSNSTNRWILVNVGKCKVLDDYFKPLWSSNDPVSRMELYLSILGTEAPESTTK